MFAQSATTPQFTVVETPAPPYPAGYTRLPIVIASSSKKKALE
jgi:hypothetical protein